MAIGNSNPTILVESLNIATVKIEAATSIESASCDLIGKVSA